MRRAFVPAALGIGALTMIGASPLGANPEDCANGACTMRLTAPQLLAQTEKLVLARHFDEALPMIEALALAPEMTMQTHFLKGYVAAETNRLDEAAKEFRAVLRDRPDMTRARLELARVLMLQGKDSAADHHFRLAAESGDLPPEIERTIRTNRGVLRDRRLWHFNLDFGLAPDTNINGATSAQAIDTIYRDSNGLPIQLVLDANARRRSGLGQTVSVSAGVRLRLSDGMAMLLDADGQVSNYKGKRADDISALLAAGPELTFKNDARVSVQAIAAKRWYGGKVASEGLGGRLSYQRTVGKGSRIGVQAEVRHSDSGFGDIYSGWQSSLYATYERVVRKSMIASLTAFVRREEVRGDAYSSKEFGATLGVGGELPMGINAGLSAGVSRVLFDEPLALLSPEPRKDWRFNGRAYVGSRSIRVLGFSPSLTYSYNRADSTLDFYRTSRHRLQFGLARYF